MNNRKYISVVTMLIAILITTSLTLFIILNFNKDNDEAHTHVYKVNNEVAIPKSKSKKDHGKLRRALKSAKFNGTAILVDNNKIVDSYVAGNAVDRTKSPNTLTTSFEIDSLQKALTAGLVMQQVQEGTLKMTDRLSMYFPEVPGASQITIRSMLNMTSGLKMKALKVSGNELSSEELLDKILINVKFNPGSKWSYQPVNYLLLSEILEQATGRTYKQLFTEAYIDGLNLNQTEFGYDSQQKTNRAAGYILKGQKNPWMKTQQKTSRAEILAEMGTGQVYMSAPDFYKLLSSLLNGKVLGKRPANMLYWRPFPSVTKYYSGLYMSKNPIYLYANGYGYGFEDHVRISQDGKKAVVVFSNYQYSKHKELKQAVDKLSNQFFATVPMNGTFNVN